MDFHMKEFEKLVTGNNYIVTAIEDRSDRDTGNIIILRPDLYESCPSKVELSNALTKRLRKPGAAYTTHQICAVAICCICSQSYTVSHDKMRNVPENIMDTIWGHLGTLKVSSSRQLSNWIKSCLGSRSQTGYKLYHQDRHSSDLPISSNILLRRPVRRTVTQKPELISNVFIENTFGNTRSVRDAMISDFKILSALRFIDNKDPPTFHPDDHSEEQC